MRPKPQAQEEVSFGFSMPSEGWQLFQIIETEIIDKEATDDTEATKSLSVTFENEDGDNTKMYFLLKSDDSNDKNKLKKSEQRLATLLGKIGKFKEIDEMFPPDLSLLSKQIINKARILMQGEWVECLIKHNKYMTKDNIERETANIDKIRKRKKKSEKKQAEMQKVANETEQGNNSNNDNDNDNDDEWND